MDTALHPKEDIDRLYVSRKGGGREHASIGDCVDASIQEPKNNTEKSKDILHTASFNSINNINMCRYCYWSGNCKNAGALRRCRVSSSLLILYLFLNSTDKDSDSDPWAKNCSTLPARSYFFLLLERGRVLYQSPAWKILKNL